MVTQHKGSQVLVLLDLLIAVKICPWRSGGTCGIPAVLSGAYLYLKLAPSD